MREMRERARARVPEVWREKGGEALLPLLSAAAVLATAAWLRTPSLPYLLGIGLATGGLLHHLWRLRADSRVLVASGRTILLVVASVGMLVFAAAQQLSLSRIDRAWPAYEHSSRSEAASVLASSLARAEVDLAAAAETALDAPEEPEGAFSALSRLVGGEGERAILLDDFGGAEPGGGPFAWAGRARVVPDLRAGTHVVETPFYTILAVVRTRGERRATATVVIQAVPPADRLATTLVSSGRTRAVGQGFEFEIVSGAGAAQEEPGLPVATLALSDDRQLRAVPAPLVKAEVQLRAEQSARTGALVLLALLGTAFVLLVWPSYGLAGSAGVLVTGLAVLGLVPFNEASNITRFFDPSVYFASVGGPWTGSVGVLALTGGFLLLGVLLVVARYTPPRSRLVPLLVVVLLGVGAPFLLRDLARGIQAPPGGVVPSLWLAYQVALFLVGTALVVAVAAAGRALLRGRGVLPLMTGPLLALSAALAAPLLWEGPGRWPGWYVVWWIASIVALALARRGRRLVPNAALIAGLGAAVLVWGALARERADRAVSEVAALDQLDAAAVQLLERFAADLGSGPAPHDAAALLRAFVASDLASADYPVLLGAWSADGSLRDSLVLWETGDAAGRMRDVADTARLTNQAVLTSGAGALGSRLLLAVPHVGGGVTTVLTAPASSLFPPDPYLSLLGLRRAESGEGGYALIVTPVRAPHANAVIEPGWERADDELHADWVTLLDGRPWRAHAEVELRGLDALIPRGTLVLLLNLILATAIWALSSVGDGALTRWFERRMKRWARSYRVRLSIVLFGFFVVPALAFAAWSSRRIQSDELQSRELLVRETLRVAEGNAVAGTLQSVRPSAPLFVYSGGRLQDTNDELLAQLASAGALLPPDVYLSLEQQGELVGSRLHEVAGAPVLFGYRLTSLPEGAAVLAAPARGDDSSLRTRRRDVSILVLFATVMGAAAALWLSGVAARQFARPIGALRRAAIAVAGGQREPQLTTTPPSEFLPVFTAFRRMDSDLRASREALEAAQRRTAAVLRTVASGVVAVDRSAVVTLTNPAAEELFGASLPFGTPIEESPAAPVAQRVRSFLSGAADEEEFEVDIGGRQLHARLSHLTGGAGGAVLTLEDVTELARAQRVLAWGEMARQVAHEIKNPLTPIRLGVQHLRRAYRDGRGDFGGILDQNVGRILNEIDHLDEIARAFSRYGTAPEERSPAEPVDVGSVARDVVELEQLGEEGVEWRLILPDVSVAAIARGDELREVLLNLLENARLAGASTVTLSVSTSDDAETVEVRVTDDGHGIQEDVLSRIFEPHFSTRTSGSGLGLAISRRMVEAWGGSIAVTSAVERGTVVTLTLASPSTR